MKLNDQTTKKLKSVSTATMSTVLFKRGFRNVWIRHAKRVGEIQERVVGPAFTLRFVPMREDLASPAALGSPMSTRKAVEEMPKGSVVIVDSGGSIDAGIFGDILCARMRKLGVAGLVSDGVIRDLDGVAATNLPVWCNGTAAPPSFAGLSFVGWQETIGCGGVAVVPGDIVLCDGDGAVVIPADQLDHALKEALEQEEVEEWILTEVGRGAKLAGLYPMDDETRTRFEASKQVLGS